MRDTAAITRPKGEEPGLPDLCTDLFSLFMHLRYTKDMGPYDYDSFRRKIIDLVAAWESQARALAIEGGDIALVRYALLAYIDELVLDSNWPFKARWENATLQLEFFKEQVAGENFFKNLDDIRRQAQSYLDQIRRESEENVDALRKQLKSKADLLEVYYLCLLLGFEGQYRILGTDKLQALIREVGSDLIRLRPSPSAELSPEWKPERLERRGEGLPRGVIIAAACLVALVLIYYVILRVGIGVQASAVLDVLQKLR